MISRPWNQLIAMLTPLRNSYLLFGPISPDCNRPKFGPCGLRPNISTGPRCIISHSNILGWCWLYIFMFFPLWWSGIKEEIRIEAGHSPKSAMDLLCNAYSTPSDDDDDEPRPVAEPTPPPLKRFKPQNPPLLPKPYPLIAGRYISKRERSLLSPALSPPLPNPAASASPGTCFSHSSHSLFMLHYVVSKIWNLNDTDCVYNFISWHWSSRIGKLERLLVYLIIFL